MDQFAGKLAVVTGGGTGHGSRAAPPARGRGLPRRHLRRVGDEHGRHRGAVRGGRAGRHRRVDVRRRRVDEAQLVAFRDHVAAAHATDHIDLLFNNAGIGGGGSFVNDPRDEWEQVFNVCWGGVYLGTRTFLPLLLRQRGGHVVNTSSVNGFWATLGGTSHTAYSAAKFAVKGFTEALITDFRQQRAAPAGVGRDARPHRHVDRVQLRLLLRPRPEGARPTSQVAELREPHRGRRASTCRRASDEDLRNVMLAMAEGFRDNAPTSAAEAATIILDGVRAGRVADPRRRRRPASSTRPCGRTPRDAYEPEFMERLAGPGHLRRPPDPLTDASATRPAAADAGVFAAMPQRVTGAISRRRARRSRPCRSRRRAGATPGRRAAPRPATRASIVAPATA